MSYYDVHAAAMAQTQAMLGDACPVFSWKGSNWQIIPDTVSLEKQLRQGGFVYDSPNVLAFHALRAQFAGDEPGPQQVITYLERRYQVDAKQVLPGELIVRYTCSDENRGAGG